MEIFELFFKKFRHFRHSGLQALISFNIIYYFYGQFLNVIIKFKLI
jgi:hypothetical protein